METFGIIGMSCGAMGFIFAMSALVESTPKHSLRNRVVGATESDRA